MDIKIKFAIAKQRLETAKATSTTRVGPVTRNVGERQVGAVTAKRLQVRRTEPSHR